MKQVKYKIWDHTNELYDILDTYGTNKNSHIYNMTYIPIVNSVNKEIKVINGCFSFNQMMEYETS